MRSRHPSRYLVGPFLSPIPREGYLSFMVPHSFIKPEAESVVRRGFQTSPDRILRAYKGRPRPGELSEEELAWGGLYWLLVREAAYDYVKHFRGSTRRGAFRIPRLLAKVCSKCGEPLYGNFCPECGRIVEEVRYLEVWRDGSARMRRLGPFKRLVRGPDAVIFLGDGEEYRVPKIIFHESVVSAVPSGSEFYIHVLEIPRGGRGPGT